LLTLILYAPGSGGNHLRNLICLGAEFDNTQALDHEKLYWHNTACSIGEVPAEGGRNVHEWNITHFTQNPDRRWILACHFGELAAWRAQIQGLITSTVIISIDSAEDQHFLQDRQQRLGQHLHPYWLTEELPWLYQPQMMQCYFAVDIMHVISLRMTDFWSSDITPTVDRLDRHLGIEIPRSRAQELHDRWREINRLTNNQFMC